MQIEGLYIFREDSAQTTKAILRNGLTVIVREQQAVPLVSVTTYVKAGYFDEDDRISGISHVIEHMFFKGTAKRPVGAIATETKGLGGYLNASTYYDRTVYHTVVPAENALKALDIQSDALWNSTYDPDELKREIEVVLQENNRKLDNPSAVASEKLYSVAFQQHRMRRWRIGTVEGLRAMTRDDVAAYVKKYYQPSNIILTIVGQVDREQILAEVIRLYGSIVDQPVERDLSPEEPVQQALRYGWQRGAIEQNRIAIGFHTPGLLSSDAHALEVLAAVFSEGRASRLNRFVRDEKGLITSGSAHTESFRDLGLFEVDFQTSQPIEAQVGVLAEIENIRRYGITEEGVARAKALIAQRRFLGREKVDDIAEELAFYEALGDWKKADSYLAEIQNVTVADAVRVATKYLTPENMTAFEYFPESETRSFTDVEYRDAVIAWVPAATEQREVDELPVTPVIVDIGASGQPVLHDLVKPIQRRSILRGPDVYILEDHRLPLVSFGIFFPGGRLLETAENAGITELMLRTAIRGTQRFNSSDIARRLENSGARIHSVNETDFFGYVVEGLSGKMDEALEILVDVLQQPSFQEDDLEREKVLQAARIRQLRENNYAYPVQLFLDTLYGDHPYSRPGIGTESAIRKIKREDLQQWFRENQRPLIPLIVIVGDTQGTGLVAPLADALTNEDLHERDVLTIGIAEPGQKKGERVETVQRRQTALVWGFPGANRASADRPVLTVLENIVSGLGGRFFDAIREKQGLAYTVHTANAFFANSGAIFTYTAFSPENEAKVKESLLKEIERLRTQGVTAEEVSKSVAYSIGAHEMRLQTRYGLVLEYARAIYSGLGVQGVSGYSDAVRKVTPEQVRSAAAKYLDPAGLREAVVRGRQ